MSNSIVYRSDIDGLRALAVLTVVFFHAGFSGFSGGYVGVDVFFVISGYLITSLICKELHAKTFSFNNFWLRRARRILPAAMVMMLVTTIVFAFFYPLQHFIDIGQSLIAQTFFSANILFWREGGYFSTSQELKPLLHMWSLAVEEQFYMLFPLLFWGVFRWFKTLLLPVIVIVCICSFLLSVIFTSYSPIPAFYLLPTRAWELGIGAVLAVMGARFFSSHPVANNIVAAIGVTFILWAVFTFDHRTPFPSYTAALPVIGAAAFIWANTNTQTYIGRCFSFKPVVGIGLISYSLYLWHWPVIVLNNWLFHQDSSLVNKIGVLFVAFILAFVSYKLVETPVRRNRKLFTNARIVRYSICGSVAAIFLGLGAVYYGNSFIVDPDGEIDRFYQMAMEPEPNRTECSDLIRKGDGISCKNFYNPSSQNVDLFVWGDSHGSALMPAFDGISKERGLNLEFSTTHGCMPVENMRRVDAYFSCVDVNSKVLEHIRASNFPVVVMVGSFVENIKKGQFRSAGADETFDSKMALSEFGAHFQETVAAVKSTGAKVLVFTEPPRTSVGPVDEFVRLKTLGQEPPVYLVKTEGHEDRISAVYSRIDEADIDRRLDYSGFFCPDSECRAYIDGQSLYKDSSHISNFGAKMLIPLMEVDLVEFIEGINN